MKKIILACLLLISSIGFVKAQTSGMQSEKNAIGLRLGWGAEASYQRVLSSSNRLEADLGIDFGDGINFAGLYQWVFDLSGLAPGFNWYVGPGVGLSLWSSDFAVGVLGNIGIEYNFRFPLQLSLDWRPGAYINTASTNFGFSYQGVCIGARYRF